MRIDRNDTAVVFIDPQNEVLINFRFLAHAVLPTADVVRAMRQP